MLLLHRCLHPAGICQQAILARVHEASYLLQLLERAGMSFVHACACVGILGFHSSVWSVVLEDVGGGDQ